jgi:hypothetical protein
MKDLILLMTSSAAITYSVQNLINHAQKNGLASLFLNPYITITLLVWCQIVLFMCIADKTVDVIRLHQSSELVFMYFVMLVLTFAKTKLDLHKLNKSNTSLQEVKHG